MLPPGFDAQPTLTGAALTLRPLAAADLDNLHTAANHPDIWAGHPAKDRYKREVFESYFQALLNSAATLVVIDRHTGTIIGCSRYYAAPDQPDSISIGFTFLNNAYWGGGTNFELKRLMLEHAFKTVDEVWFHIDPSNLRSQKATGKLGAECVYEAVLDLGGKAVLWGCYRLRHQDWAL